MLPVGAREDHMTPIESYRARSLIRQSIRQYFHKLDYLELDTPCLVPCPGTEVHLDYFESHWVDFQNKKHQLFLRSSPELHMKQALSQGLERCFTVGPCFRNGGEYSQWHHPEFTMLEWYQTGISYEDFMTQTEGLIRFCHEQMSLQGFTCAQLPKKFHRISVFEAFQQYAKIELVDEDQDLARKGIAQGFVSLRENDDFETAFFKILLDVIEPKLTEYEAIFLYDYPASQAALAKVSEGRAKRFELYLHGVELCNAFAELTDPDRNKDRFEQAQIKRAELNKQKIQDDPAFYKALAEGLPPCCGNALGVDRLLALLLGLNGIQELIPFRHNQIFPYSES